MISVTILVKNAARTLRQVLASVTQFPEVLIIDTGSTDETLTIASSFSNVRIFKREFTGFGQLHNEMAELATYDWILSLDGDELLSPALQKELTELSLSEECLYYIPFHNYFNNKHIRTTSWHPDNRPRLYHRRKTSFSELKVHERIQCHNLTKVTLRSPVLHYPYQNISDFLIKMEFYSTLFAEQNVGKRRSSPLIALFHAMAGFFRSYLLRRGILGGYEGFFISLYIGHTAFYKYLKLYHLNKEKAHGFTQGSSAQ